jgi:hypothetical protein
MQIERESHGGWVRFDVTEADAALIVEAVNFKSRAEQEGNARLTLMSHWEKEQAIIDAARAVHYGNHAPGCKMCIAISALDGEGETSTYETDAQRQARRNIGDFR